MEHFFIFHRQNPKANYFSKFQIDFFYFYSPHTVSQGLLMRSANSYTGGCDAGYRLVIYYSKALEKVYGRLLSEYSRILNQIRHILAERGHILFFPQI